MIYGKNMLIYKLIAYVENPIPKTVSLDLHFTLTLTIL